jgi:hypothetical protein
MLMIMIDPLLSTEDRFKRSLIKIIVITDRVDQVTSQTAIANHQRDKFSDRYLSLSALLRSSSVSLCSKSILSDSIASDKCDRH